MFDMNLLIINVLINKRIIKICLITREKRWLKEEKKLKRKLKRKQKREEEEDSFLFN